MMHGTGGQKMSEYIDKNKLILYLNDLALSIAPSEKDEGTKRLILQIKYETLQWIMDDIANRQTADVRENVHGEWVDIIIDDVEMQKCSVCGYGEYVLHRPYFCPNCGADMRGEEE